MKLKLKAALTLGLLSLASTASWAMLSIPDGWYLEGNFGSSKAQDLNYPGKTNRTAHGGNINIGYKFMPYFGLEAGYTRYGDVLIRDGADNKAAKDTHDSYDLAGKAILPIAMSGLEAFAKVGVQRLSSKVSITNQDVATSLGIASSNRHVTGLYLGAGAQYYVMPELAIVGQWARAKGNSRTGSMDLISAGLNFNFN